jgi:hypothetical protein
MSKELEFTLAMACVIPAIVGLLKWKQIHSSFHPFIYMMWLVVLNELIVRLLGSLPNYTNFRFLVINIYMLFNFGMFLWLIVNHQFMRRKSSLWFFGMAICVGLANYFYTHLILQTFYYLLCFVSVVMLFFSIDILSKQVTSVKTKLNDNFWFWFSSISIVYNAFTLLIFASIIFALSKPLAEGIGAIEHFINPVCYILFAIALFRLANKEPKLSIA